MDVSTVVPLPDSLKECGCPNAKWGRHLTTCGPAVERILLRKGIMERAGDLMAQAERDDHEPLPGMRWCPECNGEGVVVTMDASPDMNEHERPCTYPGCESGRGMVVDLNGPERHPSWCKCQRVCGGDQ